MYDPIPEILIEKFNIDINIKVINSLDYYTVYYRQNLLCISLKKFLVDLKNAFLWQGVHPLCYFEIQCVRSYILLMANITRIH